MLMMCMDFFFLGQLYLQTKTSQYFAFILTGLLDYLSLSVGRPSTLWGRPMFRSGLQQAEILIIAKFITGGH